jgi:hypothetical protein
MSAAPELLQALASVLDAQRQQIALSRESLQLTRSLEDLRRQELQSMREDEARWREEARALNRSSIARSRVLVRVYGALMVLAGALLATLWIQAFTH